MVEIQKSEIEIKEKNSFLKDSFIIWDSLSVGITSHYKKFDWIVKWGKQTSWMLEQLKNNPDALKDKKIMFVLWWTNDVFSNKSAKHIIKNIDEMAQIARQNWVKFVVGTIPPFSPETKAVQKALRTLRKTPEQLNTIISEVNDYIKWKYEFIDYHSILVDNSWVLPKINSKYEARRWADWIHPFNAYKIMGEAQKQKFEEILKNENISDKKWDIISETEKSIISLENSISSIETKNLEVMKDMSDEQKNKVSEIISERKKILEKYKEILGELKKFKSELLLKRKEIDSYDKNDFTEEDKKSKEYLEFQEKISDLEKRIFELEEAQTILYKELRLLSSGQKINWRLEKKDISDMETISTLEFLKKPSLERLKYVTIWNIESSEVANWNVKDLEINFTFNGKFNRQIYMSTTAGMILPDEVREVIVDWKIFSRSEKSLKWEFFSENWKRLIIKDETKISISKLMTKQELENNFKSKIDESKYEKNSPELDIALEAEKRWIPEKVALDLFLDKIKNIENIDDRRAILEELFIDIERKKWLYNATFWYNWQDSDWKMSIKFISYLVNWDKNLYEKISKDYWFNSDEIETWKQFFKEIVPLVYSWKLDLEKFNSLNISSEDILKIRNLNRFVPGSKEAVMLFKIATKTAWLPEQWATSESLHYILKRESNWRVWVLNYTIKWMDLNTFKAKALSSNTKNPIWTRSTASGLWQLLLSNIDIYYPSWRNWIWDPIEEAIWFMNYIKDRYWNPDVAGGIYGKKWYFNHPTKGRKYKWFQEWY